MNMCEQPVADRKVCAVVPSLKRRRGEVRIACLPQWPELGLPPEEARALEGIGNSYLRDQDSGQAADALAPGTRDLSKHRESGCAARATEAGRARALNGTRACSMSDPLASFAANWPTTSLPACTDQARTAVDASR